MTPQTIVVDLTGNFLTNDYSIRIHTFSDTRFDYVVVDTSSQDEVNILEITPSSADISQAIPTCSISSGNFTRYGDVLPIVSSAGNKFVIGRQGDKISLLFPVISQPPSENMVRDYFLVTSVWFIGSGLPYMNFAVDPLPFHDMSSYLYPSTESYPYDADHLRYLKEYNIRAIAP